MGHDTKGEEYSDLEAREPLIELTRIYNLTDIDVAFTYAKPDPLSQILKI